MEIKVSTIEVEDLSDLKNLKNLKDYETVFFFSFAEKFKLFTKNPRKPGVTIKTLRP